MTTFINITEADVKKLNKSLNTDLSKDDVLDIIQSNQEQNNFKPSSFIQMLIDDQPQFQKAAIAIHTDILQSDTSLLWANIHVAQLSMINHTRERNYSGYAPK